MAIFSATGLSTAPVTNVLDEGLYSVQINKIESVVSNAKGTPGLDLDLTVLDGPVQQGTGSYPAGRKIRWTLWLSNSGPGQASGLQRLAKLCRAAGVPQDDNLETDLFIGHDIVIRGKHAEYNGEPKFEIADFRKPA